MIKEKLFFHCENYIQKRKNLLEQRKNELQLALTYETKSSAGDKHETGRAMIQIEREKLGNQLLLLEKEFQKLRSLKNHYNTGIVSLGSVVRTDKENFYIALAAGPCDIEIHTYYCISPTSPIGKLLLGKKAKEHINFNSKISTITEIL
ncbi:MAG: 3-oxoacyl-ACP synthase [Flavobacteriaceae bacterium]|jgi:transcription elongation GreA/GreB family factor|nr:3-oxoacyl-ACP synthase [Flavobacteriaceae bacterium]